MQIRPSDTSIAAMTAPRAESIIVVVCNLTILAALVLGVGIPNHMVLRHVVQTLPAWAVVILATRRAHVAGWIGLPVFAFWLVLMLQIWLYLFGLLHLLSGNFTTWEIAMTIIVGVTS